VRQHKNLNTPTGESGPVQKVGENFNMGRGVMQTFKIDEVNAPTGFMMTHIVITVYGAGTENNLYSLYLFDVNIASDAGGFRSAQ
jgi:hypothetical protein